MATNDGKCLRGVVGNLTFRFMNGKNVVQTRVGPGRIKHTKATTASGLNFGESSRLAAAIKQSSKNRLYDPHMSQNLTGLLHPALKKRWDEKAGALNLDQESFAGLNHFNFNSYSKVDEMIPEWPVVQLENNKLMVTLPSFNIPVQFPFPKRSIQCELIIGVSLFRLADKLRSQYEEKQSICFTKGDGLSPAINWEFEAPEGCLCIVSLYLEYAIATKEGWYVINDKKFNPAGICRAILNDGKYTGKEELGKWLKINNKSKGNRLPLF